MYDHKGNYFTYFIELFNIFCVTNTWSNQLKYARCFLKNLLILAFSCHCTIPIGMGFICIYSYETTSKNRSSNSKITQDYL